MSLGEGIVKFLQISRYYPDIIRYPDYPRIGLLSARPDRIIYPPQVWEVGKKRARARSAHAPVSYVMRRAKDKKDFCTR